VKPLTTRNKANRAAHVTGVADEVLIDAIKIEIELWPIERPKPYPKNARKWSASAVEKVASSIRTYGFRQPIVVDVHGVIIIGHLRLAAAKSLRLTEVPVHLARDLTPTQVRGLRLMDNRSHEEAEWDFTLLAPELAELSAESFDLGLTGFDVHELDVLLRDPLDEESADQAPPLPEIAATQAGDLWLCGDHRVLCGDATSPEAVAHLLSDRKPRVMVTDPPYGISLDSEWRDRAGINKHGPAEASYMKKRTVGHTETSIGRHAGGLVGSVRAGAEPRRRIRVACEHLHPGSARWAAADWLLVSPTNNLE
jgi:ParB-like chromosome segregation protein Spo0J